MVTCNDPQEMPRAFLVPLLCFALVLMGVTGVHAHLPAPEVAIAHGAHAHGGAHIVSIIDTDHDADHDDDGDIDIEPLVKAFGKTALVASIAIVLTLIAIVVVSGRLGCLLLPVSPPLRPPRTRLRFFLLPPSHAPPASLR